MKGLMNLFSYFTKISKDKRETNRNTYSDKDMELSLRLINSVWDNEFEFIELTNEFEKALNNNSNLFEKAVKLIENTMEKSLENKSAGSFRISLPEYGESNQVNGNVRLYNTVLKFIEILTNGQIQVAPFLKGSTIAKTFDKKELNDIKILCLEIEYNRIYYFADTLDIEDEVFRSNVFLFVDQIFKDLIPETENENFVNQIFYEKEEREYKVSPRSIHFKKTNQHQDVVDSLKKDMRKAANTVNGGFENNNF